jgi:hypothetical protein
MMKVLRKYNKQLLAVVTAFILVSWLIGDPLMDMLAPSPARIKVGTAFGETIRVRDMNPSRNTTIILDALGIPNVNWRNPGGMRRAEVEPLKSEHWYLLEREAREAGVVVTESDVDQWFVIRQLPPAWIDQVRKNHQVSIDQIRAAVAEYIRVQRYEEMSTAVTHPSERQIRHYARDTQDKIRVALARFRAQDFVDAEEPLEEAELAAHASWRGGDGVRV